MTMLASIVRFIEFIFFQFVFSLNTIIFIICFYYFHIYYLAHTLLASRVPYWGAYFTTRYLVRTLLYQGCVYRLFSVVFFGAYLPTRRIPFVFLIIYFKFCLGSFNLGLLTPFLWQQSMQLTKKNYDQNKTPLKKT